MRRGGREAVLLWSSLTFGSCLEQADTSRELELARHRIRQLERQNRCQQNAMRSLAHSHGHGRKKRSEGGVRSTRVEVMNTTDPLYRKMTGFVEVHAVKKMPMVLPDGYEVYDEEEEEDSLSTNIVKYVGWDEPKGAELRMTYTEKQVLFDVAIRHFSHAHSCARTGFRTRAKSQWEGEKTFSQTSELDHSNTPGRSNNS